MSPFQCFPKQVAVKCKYDVRLILCGWMCGPRSFFRFRQSAQQACLASYLRAATQMWCASFCIRGVNVKGIKGFYSKVMWQHKRKKSKKICRRKSRWAGVSCLQPAAAVEICHPASCTLLLHFLHIFVFISVWIMTRGKKMQQPSTFSHRFWRWIQQPGEERPGEQ